MKIGGIRMIVRLLAVATMCIVPAQGFGYNTSVSPNAVISNSIRPADGTTGQDILNGSGVKTNHIQDGAVTAAKLGIVCPDGQYLRYNAESGWACNEGTPGPQGPQGVKGDTGPQGTTARYANVITVAKSGGDFTDPMAALNSITDASATNTYLVKIMPGTYEIPGGGAAINAQSFVDIEGSGRSVTKLRVVNNFTQGGGGIVIYAYNTTNSELRNITLEAETTVSGARSLTPLVISGTSYSVQDVDINIIGDGGNTGVSVGSAARLKNVKVTFSGAATSGTGVMISGSAPVYLEDITVESQATMSNYATGIYMSGSDATVKNLKLIGFDFANRRHVGAYTVNGTLKFYDGIISRAGIHTGAQIIAVSSMIDELMPRTYDGLSPIYGKFKGVNCYNSNYDPINLNN